ncbi:MAG: cytochrome c-type biosis protein CcmF, partial [Fimbriimonadaceae bacterium]|nr:cytochrome c-type biosis protein CcmF [Fimbriimonadaceae bacterium]
MLEQPTLTVTSAPNWALGVGDIGSGLILLGCFAFVAALVLGLLRRERLSTVGFVLGAASLFGAFACLTVLFVNNQFEYQYVFSHGDALTELKYKIAGVWSGQQGSFLLWACSSAIFGLLALRGTGIYRRWFIAPYSLFLAALCGILAYETPFGLLKDAQHAGKVLMPSTGTGLAPSLEN